MTITSRKVDVIDSFYMSSRGVAPVVSALWTSTSASVPSRSVPPLEFRIVSQTLITDAAFCSPPIGASLDDEPHRGVVAGEMCSTSELAERMSGSVRIEQSTLLVDIM